MISSRPLIPRRVAITACGCISPLGTGWQATRKALLRGDDCISPVTAFDTSRCQCKTAGLVRDDQLEAVGPRRWHRSSRMLRTVLDEARRAQPDFRPEICFMATTSGGMSFGEEFFHQRLNNSSRRHSAERIAGYMPIQPVHDALFSLGWDPHCRIVSNSCASGTNALGLAFLAIRSGRYRRVLCGGYDVISQLVFAGFESLKAMTSEKCRPFDTSRSGLVLGEGAAIFFLEDLDEAVRRGIPVLAEIAGYGTASDNHHLAQPHPEGFGARLAIQRALSSAEFPPESVDYVNAHGTATLLNDSSEAQALLDTVPKAAVSSTKAMMGHSLGAAGAIEAAFCLHALEGGFLPPTLNFCRGETSLRVVENVSRLAPVRRVLNNSFGFGGSNACLALQSL